MSDDEGGYSPSESSSDDEGDELDRTYSGDDDAYQTDEVVQVQLLEETRRQAEDYLTAVGFEPERASRLVLRLSKAVDAEAIPEVCSDLIDKQCVPHQLASRPLARSLALSLSLCPPSALI